MGTINKQEEVRVIRTTKLCNCLPGGATLNYSGSTAGRPVRHMYVCTNCRLMHYLETEAESISYEPKGENK